MELYIRLLNKKDEMFIHRSTILHFKIFMRFFLSRIIILCLSQQVMEPQYTFRINKY